MKREKRMNRARLRVVLLIAAALLAAYFAVRLAFAPAQEQRQIQHQQAVLFESISQGDGRVVIENAELRIDNVDYYETSAHDNAQQYDVFYPSPADTLLSDGIGEDEILTSDNSQLSTINSQLIQGIGILSIDRLEMRLPVVSGVSGAQLKIAIGHVPLTAGIGETGNAVVAGHRSYAHGEFFNRLGEAVIGDIIQYQSVSGESMAFVVDEILEVLPGEQTAFDQPTDKSQLTLYTCTPIRTATHRLLVRATRII